MTPFSEFRPLAKILTALVLLAVTLSLYQVAAVFLRRDTISFIRLLDIPIGVFIMYLVFLRMKSGWWILLVASSLSLVALILKLSLAIRLRAVDSEIIRALSLTYAIPILIFVLLFTYQVRRHFRIVDRKNA